MIIQKARLKRLSKTFLTLIWHHCPLYNVEFERDLSFSFFTVLNVVSLSRVFVSNFALQIEFRVSESLKMLQKAYSESTLSKTHAYEWYSALKSGRDVVEDLSRSGWSSMSSTEVNIAKVKEMMTENRHLSLRETAAEFVEKGQICGKKIHGFCTTITHHLTRLSL